MRVLRLLPESRVPEKAHAGDLGYDLFAAETMEIQPGETRTVRTGIKIQFPQYFGGIVKDRSSMAVKKNIFTVAGVIDSGYRGEILVVLHNAGPTDTIRAGDKIAQLLLTPVVTVSRIDEVNDPQEWDAHMQQETIWNSRQEAGFGSTGG